MKNTMNHLLMPLMLMLLVSACGKTGPLYLPDEEPAKVSKKAPVENTVLDNERVDRGLL
ncbi:MAG: lipoprotein [Gammaproteobacteria bacterium]|nr:lipoprotein [Gammaproteobacteria bacterium]